MEMSVPLIIALNVGAAAFLTLLLTALMLLPKRLHPHRHPHLEVRDAATPPTYPRPHEHSARSQRHPQGGRGRTVTDS
jgi:hypothetical protein